MVRRGAVRCGAVVADEARARGLSPPLPSSTLAFLVKRGKGASVEAKVQCEPGGSKKICSCCKVRERGERKQKRSHGGSGYVW